MGDMQTDAHRQATSKHARIVAPFLLVGFLALVVVVGALCLVEYKSLPDNVGRTLTAEEQAQIIAENSPLTLEELGSRFSNRDRRASSNYAIDSDGNVALYVEEKNRAWTSSDRDNDERAITIEVANDEVDGNWHVSDAAYEKLIELCVDICKRNGIAEFVFTGDENGTLTTHYMFNDETICPGPYLSGKLPDLAKEVNSRL